MSSKITRKAGRKKWVVIDKEAAHDASLSWKAKGLLLYMLSMPDDWEFYVSELKNHASDGRDSTASGLKELEKAGYLVKTKKRDEEGKFKGYDYNLFEIPLPENGKPENGLSVNGKPENGKSVTTKELLKLNTNNTKKEEAIKNCNPLFEDQQKVELKDQPYQQTEKEKEKSCAKKEKVEDLEHYQETIEILELFKKLTRASYRAPKSVSSFKKYGAYKTIKGLLKNGFKCQQIQDVVKFKCKEWLQSKKMAKYCTYQTILMPSNFEKYINQMQIKPTTNGKQQTNNSEKPKTLKDLHARIKAKYSKIRGEEEGLEL